MTPRMMNGPVAVVGAGWAGLTAGTLLQDRGFPVRVFEAGRSIAGLAASVTDSDGYTFDYGAHFVSDRLADAVGLGRFAEPVLGYGESVWIGGRALSQPLGLLASRRYLSSVVGARMRRLFQRASPTRSADDWLRAEYGDVFADDIAVPLLEQWSGMPANELSVPAIGEVPQGAFATTALKLVSIITGRSIAIAYSRERGSRPWVQLVYPRGGIGSLCSSLADRLAGSVHLETPVEKIIVEDGRVRAVEVAGKVLDVSAVVSTVPAPILAKLVEGSSALDALARFRFRAMLFVCLKLEGTRLLPSVITWTPGADLPFFRVSEPPAAVPALAPSGNTYIVMDVGAAVGDATWDMDVDGLTDVCLDGIQGLIPDARNRLLGCRVMRTPVAYPIFDKEYEAERLRFVTEVPIQGLVVAGRNGEFAPLLMEDVYWRTADRVQHLIEYLRAQR